MNRFDTKLPYVLVKLKNELFGISCENVVSIAIFNQTVPLPGSPAHIRGIAQIHNRQILLTDMRVLLGMKSISQEIRDFSEVLEKRKQDHIHWLSILRTSVNEKKEFNLTTDPHACDFGKWYDNFNTDNNNLRVLLKKFDVPHRKIHSIAADVKAFEEIGDYHGAEQLIIKTEKRELHQMIALFSEVTKAYASSRREIIITLEKDNKTSGIIVDEVISVERLSETSYEFNENLFNKSGLFAGVGKRKKDNSIVLLLKSSLLVNP